MNNLDDSEISQHVNQVKSIAKQLAGITELTVNGGMSFAISTSANPESGTTTLSVRPTHPVLGDLQSAVWSWPTSDEDPTS